VWVKAQTFLVQQTTTKKKTKKSMPEQLLQRSLETNRSLVVAGLCPKSGLRGWQICRWFDLIVWWIEPPADGKHLAEKTTNDSLEVGLQFRPEV